MVEPGRQPPISQLRAEWRRYWNELGQDWRWEPLIDLPRQAFLLERKGRAADIGQYRFPFEAKDCIAPTLNGFWRLMKNKDRLFGLTKASASVMGLTYRAPYSAKLIFAACLSLVCEVA